VDPRHGRETSQPLQPIQGTPHAGWAEVQEVRVDHRGLEVPVPEELLDRPDALPVLEFDRSACARALSSPSTRIQGHRENAHITIELPLKPPQPVVMMRRRRPESLEEFPDSKLGSRLSDNTLLLLMGGPVGGNRRGEAEPADPAFDGGGDLGHLSARPADHFRSCTGCARRQPLNPVSSIGAPGFEPGTSCFQSQAWVPRQPEPSNAPPSSHRWSNAGLQGSTAFPSPPEQCGPRP
jgi:hypothetical protein